MSKESRNNEVCSISNLSTLYFITKSKLSSHIQWAGPTVSQALICLTSTLLPLLFNHPSQGRLSLASLLVQSASFTVSPRLSRIFLT